MAAGFWYWMQPRGDNIFTGTYGNSMSDAEKVYYVQSFNHAMSHIHDGDHYKWESYNSRGNVRPLTTYASKSKSLCRTFKETYIIGSYSGEQDGIACKRMGKSGWCRLKKGDAQTCALERDRTDIVFGNMNVGSVSMGSIDLGGMQITIPTYDTDIGGLGHVEAPESPDGPDSDDMKFLPADPRKSKNNIDWLTN